MGVEKADTVEPKWAVLPRDIVSNYPLLSPRLEAGRLLPVRGLAIMRKLTRFSNRLPT